MKKSKKFALLTGAVVGVTAIAAHVMKKKAEKTTYEADLIEPIQKRKMGFYEKYGKRILDIACATAAIVVFSPLYLGVAALVKLKLGSPVLFTQDRPGLIGKDGKETVFKMYKFRTMTDERDENGELLPDDVRLTKFGKWLRNTSLDELPEAFNILNGTMSVIGPRPQLVRDMTFMTKEQRARHTAKPGLSGLAQVNGRNGISWEEKLEWDRKYIQNVSFAGDVKIIVDTVKKAFIKQEGITQDDMATAEDFGDWLLRMGKVSSKEYMMNQNSSGFLSSIPMVTKNLIIINLLFWVASLVLPKVGIDLVQLFGLHFPGVTDFYPFQFITYMFMHAGILHILFNMLWLYWFGSLFLYFFSAKHLRGLYVLGGICGGLLYMIAYNVFPLFSSQVAGATLVGASASVLAIVAATAYREPNYRVQLFLFGAIRLKYLALVVIGIDVLSITSSNAGGHIAHLGGALAGLWFAASLNKGTDLTSWINWILDGFISLFQKKTWKRKPKMKVHYGNSATGREKDYDYNAHKKAQSDEVDRILEKLKKSGYDSLTTEEKKSLFDASKR